VSSRTDAAAPFRRWLVPPLSAFVFLVHPILSFIRPAEQLQDPGTGWHLATGRYILTTRAIPHQDLFSFTAIGHAWIPYSWLFEVAGALLERLGGLPLFATACMLVVAFVPVLLYRRMVRMGAAIIPALLMTLLAYLILTSHALARPHIVTYLLFAFFLERMDDVHAGRRAARSLWVLPPLTVLWCNVHGGFMVGLMLAAIFAAVAGVRALLTHDPRERRETFTFIALLVAMGLATLVNPNGLGLHHDILRFLALKTGVYFDEWRSPDFQAANAPILLFEILALMTFLVAARARKPLAWVEVALLVFFLHEGLRALRQISLFAIVAAPIVAREISVPLDTRWPSFAARWRAIAAEQAALRSPLLYVPALTAVFVALVFAGVSRFPRTLDDLQLTRGAAAFIAGHKERFARPFNTENLGGSLIYRFWPDVRVFVDDRIDVYGDRFVADDYLTVLLAQQGWRDVLARYDVDAAVVTAATPCATLLRGSPEWELAFEDEQNLIFFRRVTGNAADMARRGS
jgi:hypothetical protein